MAKQSVQKQIAKVRKPRVHISYDVEVGGAIEDRQIPFVAGVFADLSGQPSTPLPALKDRKFVEIDRENFEDVLKGVAPRLQYKVPNRLSTDGSSLGIELEFDSLDSFGPEAVANGIEPIRKLVEARKRLNELALKVNSSDRLGDLLKDVVQNTDGLKALSMGGTTSSSDSPKREDNNG